MPIADVYKQGVLAAKIDRAPTGTTFTYETEYVKRLGEPVATTLPLLGGPTVTPPGSVPAYFAGLLPEGRRLNALTRHLKVSADDEFALLVAVGQHAIGDVTVTPEGGPPEASGDALDLPPAIGETRFTDLIGDIPEFAAIAGVQEKVSSRMISLPAEKAGHEYILKLNPPEFPRVVQNEAYFLELASRCGIDHAEAEVITDIDGEVGILIKRFDRGKGGAMFAQEDGCQVLNRWPADKYVIASETLATELAANCPAETLALRKIFEQIVFAVLTGNGDAHAKNFSILQREGEWQISPAYDLPSSVFYGDFTMALSIDRKTQPPSRKKLLAFAEAIALPVGAAERTIDRLLEGTEPMIGEIREGVLGLDENRTRVGLKQLVYRRKQLSAS